MEGRRGQPWTGRAGVFGGGLAVPLLPPSRAAAEKRIQGSVCPRLAVARTSCLQGQLASKHLPKPLSFLQGDATKPLYSFLQPLPARGIPWPGPRSQGPHADLRQRTPQVRVREPGVPGAPGQGSLQQSGDNQTSWDSG